MRILKSRLDKKQGMILTVHINEGETLVAFRRNSFYELGEPLRDEIMSGDMLIDANRVVWCPIEQKWIQS